MFAERRVSFAWSRLKAFAGRASFVFVLLWGVLEPVLALFQPIAELLVSNGIEVLIAQTAVAILSGAPALFPRTRASFHVGGHGPQVSVSFGDLLGRPEHLAIPVNEFFDHTLHTNVAPGSLHGQLITRLYSGEQARVRDDFDAALENARCWQKAREGDAPTRRYELGQTAVLNHGRNRLFCFALSRTDPKTSRASSDVSSMMRALAGLWAAVDATANGETIAVPMVGGGQSNVDHRPEQLIRLLMLSIVDASRSLGRLPPIEIVLLPELESKVDLALFEKEFGG